MKQQDGDFIQDAVRRFERGLEFDRRNKKRAYEALLFRAGEQWPEDIKRQREADGRPCQTINRTSSFVKQIANDIRMAQPAVRVIATGGIQGATETDREKAAKQAGQMRQQLIRHVENRSDAQSIAYAKAADDQVASGYGAWRIVTEYASETTTLQELRIVPVDDPIGIVWDPDSRLPTREDANWVFVPVDITHEEYKRRYPGKVVSEIGSGGKDFPGNWSEWCGADTVRICEYFYREFKKRKFVELDGRLTPVEDTDAESMLAAGGRIIEREAPCVYRAVISAMDALEGPEKWIGMRFPIIPVFGEETQVGREILRWGIVEHIKDAQRRYNYFSSAHTEIVALQPKSPFIGTEKQFEGFEDVWSSANTANLPYLTYNADPAQPGPPQRSQPPVSSQGISDGIALAAEEMKAVTGIYDASLGQKSNETSGTAIMARQRESDVGSYVYAQNFGRAIRHTGRVLLDLMPRVYDTTRTFRIMGMDGRVDAVTINAPSSDAVIAAEAAAQLNDISAGEYDVVLEQGPSYTTKREEAKAGMIEFARAYPPVMQVAGDLVAKAQDWPNAEEFAKRLRATIPPPILQAAEADEDDPMPQGPAPIPPEVEEQIAQRVMQGPEFAMKDAQARKAAADARRAEIEAQIAMASAMAPRMPEEPPVPVSEPDPMQAINLEVAKKRALTVVDLEAEAVRRRMDRDMAATASVGLGEEAAEPSMAGPTPVDVLAGAVMQQGQMMQAGLQSLAEAFERLAIAQTAPRRVIRDDRNQVAGVEVVQ
jgi:hypothetical protein